MSWDDLNEAHYDWPTPEAVKAYRDKARAAIDGLITSLPLTLPIGWDSPFWIILMGIEHERIHLETSSVLIRQLPLDMVQKHPAGKSPASTRPTRQRTARCPRWLCYPRQVPPSGQILRLG